METGAAERIPLAHRLYMSQRALRMASSALVVAAAVVSGIFLFN